MAATGECFTCAFWELRCMGKHDVVIRGHLYSVGPEPSPRSLRRDLGMGGRRFDIEFFDGRRCTTHNLWSAGEIPARYRDRIPDTAVFRSANSVKVGEVTCWNPTPESVEAWPEYGRGKE